MAGKKPGTDLAKGWLGVVEERTGEMQWRMLKGPNATIEGLLKNWKPQSLGRIEIIDAGPMALQHLPSIPPRIGSASPMARVLAKLQIAADEEEIAATFESLVESSWSYAAPLSAAERGALDSVTGNLGPFEPATPQELQEQQRTLMTDLALAHTAYVFASTVSTKEAAEILGIDTSNVTRRINKEALFAVRSSGNRYRLPRWQFVDGDVVPGLETIIPAIPDGYPLEQLDAFLNAANEDCADQSPLVFLASGGSADTVAELLGELGQW